MEPQKESWEERLKECKCTGMYCNHETSEEHYIVDKDFISQERLLAQKKFGERLLEKKVFREKTYQWAAGEIVSVEDIEAEIKELGV